MCSWHQSQSTFYCMYLELPQLHVTGTNSFGMSGVNAQAIFAAPPQPAAPALQRSHPLPIQRQRFWAVPPVNHLVRRAHAGANAACIYAIDARSADTAYLAEHQVRDCMII